MAGVSEGSRLNTEIAARLRLRQRDLGWRDGSDDLHPVRYQSKPRFEADRADQWLDDLLTAILSGNLEPAGALHSVNGPVFVCGQVASHHAKRRPTKKHLLFASHLEAHFVAVLVTVGNALNRAAD